MPKSNIVYLATVMCIPQFLADDGAFKATRVMATCLVSRGDWPGADDRGDDLSVLATTESSSCPGHVTVSSSAVSSICSNEACAVREPSEDAANGAAGQSFTLSGKVFAPDGRPVPAFTVAAGPGELPARYDCVRQDVRDRQGRFSLEVRRKGEHWIASEDQGKTWVGVNADRLAAWEGWVDPRDRSRPLEVHMSPGIGVTAAVVAPKESTRRIKAILFPRREKPRYLFGQIEPLAEELPTLLASVSPDGFLRFDHVRPDRYRLFLRVDEITKAVFSLDVPATGIELGPIPVDVTPSTGRVEGRVWRPRDQITPDMAQAKGEIEGEWSFAEGYLRRPRVDGEDLIEPATNRHVEPPADAVAVRADKTGRFQVEGVPEGVVTLRFEYQIADMVRDYEWSAVVRNGQTTVIEAFNPADRQDLTLQFVVGDGSKAQYESGTAYRETEEKNGNREDAKDISGAARRRFSLFKPSFGAKLIPRSKRPISAPLAVYFHLDASRRFVLHNANPGTFRLLVYDRGYTRQLSLYPDTSNPPEHDPLVDRDVVIRPGANVVQIALGAGCITGRALPSNNRERWPAWALRPRNVEVIAVANNGHRYSRRAELDPDGTFQVPYLHPGLHSLYIHDPFSGYCLIDRVVVPAGFVDVGERTLTTGSTVFGTIQYPKLSRVPDEIVATGPSGVSVREAFPSYSSFDRFGFGGLWPGRWEITVRCNGRILAARKVELRETGTHNISVAVNGTYRD